MPQVSTFCPRCGEAIETEVPDAARVAGRAALACPSCRFAFEIAPARRPGGTSPPPPMERHAPEAARRAPASPGPSSLPDTGWAPSGSPASGSATPRGRSFKPVAAAMMLLFAAVIGLWMGLTVTFGDDLLVEGAEGMSGSGNFTGVVSDATGEGLVGVEVTMRPAADTNASGNLTSTTTDGAGRYHFADTEAGHYVVTFRHANHTTVELETLAYPDEYQPLFGASSPLTSVTMQQGDPGDVERIDIIATLESFMRWVGIGITVAALLAAAGGVAALLRRYFPLAVIGAICGILTFGFIVGSAISLIALVLIIMARREFRRGAAPASAQR